MAGNTFSFSMQAVITRGRASACPYTTAGSSAMRIRRESVIGPQDRVCAGVSYMVPYYSRVEDGRCREKERGTAPTRAAGRAGGSRSGIVLAWMWATVPARLRTRPPFRRTACPVYNFGKL